MLKNAPIGLFDSGLGGLSVWKYLVRELPNESTRYLADSAHAPYGERSTKDIIRLSVTHTEKLLDLGCKMIIVACNTATGAAINYLRSQYACPFVGMEPAIKPAAALSKTGVIGVLATAQTFEANHFNQTKNRYAEGIEVKLAIGKGLVELVESGKADSTLLKQYLDPMITAGIDQLVLGCTHYPFLIPVLNRILHAGIKLHDPAPAVAKQARRILEQDKGHNDSEQPVSHHFGTSGDPELLRRMVEGIDQQVGQITYSSYQPE